MSDYSNEVLAGFIEEAKSYLPIIRENAKKFAKSRSKNRGELMEESYRYAHTIKGAAAMIGLSPLSHIAYYLEDVLADVAAEKLSISDTKDYIRQAVNQIDLYLDGILDDSVNAEDALIRATRSYNELRGLPTDDATVEEVIAQVAGGSAEIEFAEAAAAELEDLMTMEEVPDYTPDYSSDDSAPSIMFDEEFMAELREAFQEEAEDHLGNTARLLNHLDKQPNDKEQLRELRRVIHTLKGAAATVGISQMAKLTHRMEDLLDHIDEVGAEVSRPVMDLMFDSADMLEDQLKTDIPESQLTQILSRYDSVLVGDTGTINIAEPDTVNVQKFEFEKPRSNATTKPIKTVAKPEPEPEPEPEPVTAAQKEEQVAAPLRTTSEVVRVPLDRLDELVRLTSEWVITRTTLEQRINDLTRYTNEIAPSLERLQRISNRLDTDYQELSYASQNVGVREGQPVAFAGGGNGPIAPTGGGGDGPASFQSEFDALEFDRYTELYTLSRDLSETTSDIKTTHNDLRTLLADFDSILTRQGRISSEVQDKLMRTRMVPLSTIVTRLQRAVRVVARKKNKQVDLIIEGEHIELDKKVLEDIADPLLHLLRNSVDHGIEPSELRMVTGKPERGTIRVRAYYEGSQVVIKVTDDGAGIDIDKIRSKAVSSGYIPEGEVEAIADDDLRQLIFQPGFSTADEVTDTSGRGVGMDAVKTSVGRLKGTIHLASDAGEGTDFTIRLPLTLAVMRALLVKARGKEYALPLSSVAQILRLDGDAVKQIGSNPVIRVGDNVLPIVQLAELLGMQPADLSERKRIPVLLINAGDEQVAMIVDEIDEGREIVIKTLGNHLRYVHGVTGATLMGDGRVVLILNPPELVSEPSQQQARQWTPPSTVANAAVQKKVLDIMVVDDSVSVRKVVANMVSNAGWQPRMARDGLEALEMIQSGVALPDAILLDIEMPRMNGFELTATLRANDIYRDIPIVMLTSRAGDKHRTKAFELGVNDYLVKPYREEDLLAAVRKVAVR